MSSPDDHRQVSPADDLVYMNLDSLQRHQNSSDWLCGGISQEAINWNPISQGNYYNHISNNDECTYHTLHPQNWTSPRTKYNSMYLYMDLEEGNSTVDPRNLYNPLAPNPQTSTEHYGVNLNLAPQPTCEIAEEINTASEFQLNVNDNTQFTEMFDSYSTNCNPSFEPNQNADNGCGFNMKLYSQYKNRCDNGSSSGVKCLTKVDLNQQEMTRQLHCMRSPKKLPITAQENGMKEVQTTIYPVTMKNKTVTSSPQEVTNNTEKMQKLSSKYIMIGSKNANVSSAINKSLVNGSPLKHIPLLPRDIALLKGEVQPISVMNSGIHKVKDYKKIMPDVSKKKRITILTSDKIIHHKGNEMKLLSNINYIGRTLKTVLPLDQQKSILLSSPKNDMISGIKYADQILMREKRLTPIQSAWPHHVRFTRDYMKDDLWVQKSIINEGKCSFNNFQEKESVTELEEKHAVADEVNTPLGTKHTNLSFNTELGRNQNIALPDNMVMPAMMQNQVQMNCKQNGSPDPMLQSQGTDLQKTVQRQKIVMKTHSVDKVMTLKCVPLTIPKSSPQEVCAESQLSENEEAEPELDSDEQQEQHKCFIAPKKKLMYRCNFCGLRQATRNSLITHIKGHQLPFCKICLLITNTEEQLQNHMIKGHPGKAKLYQHNVHYVTSKYGRRRPVLETSSLISRRKHQLKPREFDEDETEYMFKEGST